MRDSVVRKPWGRPFAAVCVAVGMLASSLAGLAGDWPQYRGPASDGATTEPMLTTWPAAGPPVVWSNPSLTNGFSSFVVSQGRAFTLVSRSALGAFKEYCVGVDALTGAEQWAALIGDAPWDPAVNYNGGAGTYPYDTGDGPRTTPAVQDGRVLVLSALLKLVCLNAANGAEIWSKDLRALYGGSVLTWENGASPCLDGDLVFVNLNTAFSGKTLAAFRISDGSLAWSSQTERATHTTPVVATMHGVRQVIFATQTGLVSLDRSTGAFLWKYPYPFPAISTSMGASPLVYSNFVFCSASYGRGTAAARIDLIGNTWTPAHLYYKSGVINYRSIWMSPVCYQGHIYTLCGDNSSFGYTALNCIDLATGDLKWSTNGFGMGGLILVDKTLLVLTEDGRLVSVQPSPSAYLQTAEYRAFQFDPESRGKCWNHPAFSEGRIYARSTRGGVCLDVAAPQLPRLKLVSAELQPGQRLRLWIGAADGSPIDPARVARMEVRASATLGAGLSQWTRLTNELVWVSGKVRVENVPAGNPAYYIAGETP